MQGMVACYHASNLFCSLPARLQGRSRPLENLPPPGETPTLPIGSTAFCIFPRVAFSPVLLVA